MKLVSNLLNRIQLVTTSELERQILYVLIGVVLLCSGAYYVTSSTSDEYATTISALHSQAKNAGKLSVRFAHAQREKRMVSDLLRENKTFEIKSFVENFFRDQHIRPTSDWITITSKLPGNDQLEELSLKVLVSGQSMENVVTLLGNLAASEIVYVRELGLEKEQGLGQNNKITLELVLATLRFTSRFEE